MTDLKNFWRVKNEEEREMSTEVVQIKTDDIRPNRAQPRAEFDQNAIIRLADSIRRYGILQPLTVRRTEDEDDSYSYELIAGERRLRASKMLGYLTVPCIIMETTAQVSAELAIIENLLREDLNMFEQAYGFKKLIENHHLTQEEVARRMSMSQSAVANKLRLLRLSYEEQKIILETGLTERHARALLRLDGSSKRMAAIHYVSERKMNVQETEKYIEELLGRREHPERSEKEAASMPTFAFVDPEEEAQEVHKFLQKKVDEWKKQGKDVSLHVNNGAKTMEIVIRFNK